MRVIIAPSAQQDLASIGDFIARDNPARAATFVEELFEVCMKLADHPEAFALRPALGARIRVQFHRNYAIIYRVDPGQVSVVRVSHGSRDLTALVDADPNAE